MTNIDELMEQNILQYEARQKHAQELFASARKLAGHGPEHDNERMQINCLAQEHDQLSKQLEQLKERRQLKIIQDKHIYEAGPMAVWDILAGDLEKLVERLTP
ncbi:hypothetical protein [Sulfuriferula nivalis]|uniref:Uncharacterized protein n=1 Tax=Sulfuriferula nivalis TaxID=2675298 RepID=A0A809RPR5_9PROT|nr:hypothetical protein [Sulfuriferula nivalis]BBP00831.1 hypothetical protein SFSGTM_15390 [Sulfuriferula nivalis]